jgi:hypothetical protein
MDFERMVDTPYIVPEIGDHGIHYPVLHGEKICRGASSDFAFASLFLTLVPDHKPVDRPAPTGI